MRPVRNIRVSDFSPCLFSATCLGSRMDSGYKHAGMTCLSDVALTMLIII